MKLRQLRYVHEVSRRGLNVTAAAEALFTSQPGVSKQIRLLEEELGVDIFVRNGKHLVEVTPAGKRILDYTERLLLEVDNIKNVADDVPSRPDRGDLSIATTHTQARYALPPVIRQVPQAISEGQPASAPGLAAADRKDGRRGHGRLRHRHRGHAALFEDLVMLPCYHWNRCVLVRPDHPLAKSRRKLTLKDVAAASAHHLHLRFHRPLQARPGVRRARPQARRGADRRRRRRHQDLRAARAGHRHRRQHGL